MMENLDQLYLNMGMVTGAMTNPEARDAIVNSINNGGLRRGYVELLHTQISDILDRTMDGRN